MDAGDDIGAGQRQQVVIALEIVLMVGKAFPPVVRILQALGLDHGPHGAVDHQYAVAQGLRQG